MPRRESDSMETTSSTEITAEDWAVHAGLLALAGIEIELETSDKENISPFPREQATRPRRIYDPLAGEAGAGLFYVAADLEEEEEEGEDEDVDMAADDDENDMTGVTGHVGTPVSPAFAARPVPAPPQRLPLFDITKVRCNCCKSSLYTFRNDPLVTSCHHRALYLTASFPPKYHMLVSQEVVGMPALSLGASVTALGVAGGRRRETSERRDV